MSNCPFCKAAYKPGASYCHGCGRRVVEYRLCSNKSCRNYGKVLADDEAFCSGCGEQSSVVYAGSSSQIWVIYLIIFIIICAFLLAKDNESGSQVNRPGESSTEESIQSSNISNL